MEELDLDLDVEIDNFEEEIEDESIYKPYYSGPHFKKTNLYVV